MTSTNTDTSEAHAQEPSEFHFDAEEFLRGSNPAYYSVDVNSYFQSSATEGNMPSSSSSTRTPHADETSRVSKTYESLLKQKEEALQSYTELCKSTGTEIDPAIDKFRWKGNRFSDNPSNNALAQRNFAIRRQLRVIESANTILRNEGGRGSKDA